MKAIVLSAFLLPFAASAVTVKNCPEKLYVGYEALEVYSNARVAKEAEKVFTDYETVQEDHTVLQKINSWEYQELRFDLVSTKNSICAYLPAGIKNRKAQGDNETRIFTRNGRDILRISLSVGENYFWTYHTVTEMSPAGFDFASISSPIYGYFDHGAPRVKMGWADDVAVSVEE